MKRLIPETPKPAEYCEIIQSANANAKLNVEPDCKEPVESKNFNIEQVPPKTMHSYNLKKIKSFKAIRRKYKLSNQEKVFIADLSILLNEYKPANHQFDQDILIHILNISEHFFIYGSKLEREEIKSKAVKTLLMPYFRNDEELYNIMVHSVWHKVVKTNIFKRTIKRMSKIFFFKH